MKSSYKTILISLLPAIIFFLVYKYISFRYAIILGFCIGVIIYLSKYIQEKRLTSFDYLGIFGLVFQTVIGFLAENPKTYFIYPLISSSIYAILFGISLLFKHDVVSYLAKDFVETEKIYIKCKPLYRTITYIWTFYFFIKVIIKLIGLYVWSFDLLYLVNWLIGTPITLLLLWFSFSYPEKYCERKYSKINNLG